MEGKIASNIDDKTMEMAAIIAENQRLKAEVLLLKKIRSVSFEKRASIRYAFILGSLSDDFLMPSAHKERFLIGCGEPESAYDRHQKILYKSMRYPKSHLT